jgi:hypothetical protein
LQTGHLRSRRAISAAAAAHLAFAEPSHLPLPEALSAHSAHSAHLSTLAAAELAEERAEVWGSTAVLGSCQRL